MTKTTTISSRCTIAFAAWFASAAAALAQSGSRPFSVAGGEGGGGAEGGITGWLFAVQSRLTHLIAAKIHALHGDPRAVWGLIAFGLAYGVFHAAGPGHGKAVIASYMLANERSLKRGALLSLLAALLQAAVAIALVGAAGFVFNATASEMNRAANWIQLASYGAVALIGLWLVWRKGAELVAALQRNFEHSQALAVAPAYAGVAWNAPALTLPMAQFQAASPGGAALASDECPHVHAPDPALLDGAFLWRDAVGTVIAAGVRPCSGAILVLVFALAQGLFAAGVEATFAMALGTAVTTGALASIAVFAKSTAVRLAAGENSRAALVARSFEFAAALGVLAFGVALLMFGARGGA
ncbi:MAG TPA: nickel/cobalt transporter [Roseiarcus sp.]|nr:nickel/cobalt transporter [Roseiarcus sp.]